MSLVGPRPLVPPEAELIGQESPRFTVKPGVTGLAQVSGRDEITAEQRTAYDVEYVEKRSMRLDTWIMLKTLALVLIPGRIRLR
jgi:lipopolysaccharide/colanic/teichoic acid biosynthesis glycosyltransferase